MYKDQSRFNKLNIINSTKQIMLVKVSKLLIHSLQCRVWIMLKIEREVICKKNTAICQNRLKSWSCLLKITEKKTIWQKWHCLKIWKLIITVIFDRQLNNFIHTAAILLSFFTDDRFIFALKHKSHIVFTILLNIFILLITVYLFHKLF